MKNVVLKYVRNKGLSNFVSSELNIDLINKADSTHIAITNNKYIDPSNFIKKVFIYIYIYIYIFK